MTEEQKTFYAGYYKVKITPPFGSEVPGYAPSIIRYSNGILSDLYLHAVAFSDGENRAILFCADAIGIIHAGAARIKKLVSERLGIPEDCVYTCCTHSHTAFRINTDESKTPGDQLPRLMQLFCDAGQMAVSDLKPCRILASRGEAKGVGFIRRYLMKDGSTKTNPKTMNPDIVRPDGVQDNSVQLVRLVREGGKEILLTNFGTHADVIGGSKYCADWPGYFVDNLKAAFDGNVETVMLVGCQGNSNHINRLSPVGVDGKRGGTGFAQHMARVLVGEVLKIYDDAKPLPYGPIKGYFTTAMAEKNPSKEEDFSIAERINAHYQAHKGEGWSVPMPEDLLKYHMSYRRAARIVRLRNQPDLMPVEVSGLQIGQFVLIGLGGEPFCEIGLHIKEESRMQMTFVTCMTNGGRGYFPCSAAYIEGSYEADTSNFGPTVEEKLVEAATGFLTQMDEAARSTEA